MKKAFFIFLFLCLKVAISADVVEEDSPAPTEIVSPEVIEQQLESAEKLFQEAREMFNPWYAGPLLTGSAHILGPGLWNIQPYLFVTTEYGTYNNKRQTTNTPNTIVVNVPVTLQAGIFKWLDASLTVQGFYNYTQGQHSTHWGDTTLGIGIGLVEEGPYLPAFSIQLNQSFPTGKYENLDATKLGTDSTGSGAYQTSFGLNFTKVVWWWLLEHPMCFRAAFAYKLSTTVPVHGFHAYGGGFDANGKVRPGNVINIDIGYEFSFTQKWVIATDFVYVYQNETTFNGIAGTSLTGDPAPNSLPSSDQLSLAPALEYNPTPNLGIVGGVWFTVWGRNSAEFISGVFTTTYTF